MYNASSGARLHSWAKGKNAERLDADSGVAVFTPQCKFVDNCAGRVYAVRMTLGKTVQLAAPGVGLVGLEIESSGVVYAYNRRGGRIVVRSRGQVEAALS